MTRKMPSESVHERVSLPNHQGVRQKDQESRGVLSPLHRPKAHRWPGGRLGDRFGVSGVLLLATHKRLDVNRWNEPHVVPETADRPSPLVRRRARFHRHDGARLLSQEAEQLCPRHLLAQYRTAVLRRGTSLEDSLCQVDPDDRSLLHGCLLLCGWSCNITSVAHFDAVGGGIHPIKKLKRRRNQSVKRRRIAVPGP